MAVIDLEDLGHYARHVLDHPRDFEGRDLEIASEHITWDQLVKTFTKVRQEETTLKQGHPVAFSWTIHTRASERDAYRPCGGDWTMKVCVR
jgi:hypothetical protein